MGYFYSAASENLVPPSVRQATSQFPHCVRTHLLVYYEDEPGRRMAIRRLTAARARHGMEWPERMSVNLSDFAKSDGGFYACRCRLLRVCHNPLVCVACSWASIHQCSKVTCDQFANGKVGLPRTTAIWLNGYYHGKTGSTTIDTQQSEDMFGKLINFCQTGENGKVPVMQAIEHLLKSK